MAMHMPAPIPRHSVLAGTFVVLSTLITVAAAGFHEADILRRNLEEKAVGLAQGVAAVFAREMKSYGRVLEVERMIRATHADEPDHLASESGRVAALFGGRISLVRDMGQSIAILSAPGKPADGLRTEIAPGDQDWTAVSVALRQARATGKDAVSVLHQSGDNLALEIDLVTPGIGASEPPEQFIFHIPASAFSTLLAEQSLGQGVFASVTDTSGTVFARSVDAARFVGRKAPRWYLDRRSTMANGVLSGPSMPGSAFPAYDFAFFRMRQDPGWYVTLGFPPGTLNPRLLVGPDAIAWGGVAFLLSLLAAWLALGGGVRAERLRAALDAAAGQMLRGLPGALVQIERRAGEPPRVTPGHGLLAPMLAGDGAQTLAADLPAAVERAIASGQPVDLTSCGRTLLVSGWPDRSGPGVSRCNAYVADVTELRRTEAAARAAARLAALGETHAAVAHEVSQPLNVMSLAAENGAAALRAGDAGAAAGKFQSIMRQARKARQIVDRLLHFARDGDDPPALSPVALEACFAQALELAEPRMTQLGIALELTPEAPHATALATPLELEHVFLNLLLNAIDAIAARAEGPRRIMVRIGLHGGQAVVEIADTGGGVAPGVLARAFEPFVSSKPPGTGTGLGLAYVRSAMTAFGGSVSLANAADGAVVRLVFVAAPAGAG